MRNPRPYFQRLYYRLPFSAPVEFRILKYNRRHLTHLSAKRGPGAGHDIGEDGLSFTSPYLLPVELVIRVAFGLPDYGEQRILARVIRSTPTDRGYLTAVQFLNLNGSRKEKMRGYITAETRKNYKFLNYL